jgi:dTDP-4-dehydrorhamnose 3,5-epimerase
MQLQFTDIPDVVLCTPQVFEDDRGYFFESFNQKKFPYINFVQDNQSFSRRGVLRGLHYQIKKPQCKLVRVVSGEILDVAVDLRISSPTFKKYVAYKLSSDNQQQLFIPDGFAHGFLVLSDSAIVAYKASEYWIPEYDRCIRWNDPELNISWNTERLPRLSIKDSMAPGLLTADLFE